MPGPALRADLFPERGSGALTNAIKPPEGRLTAPSTRHRLPSSEQFLNKIEGLFARQRLALPDLRIPPCRCYRLGSRLLKACQRLPRGTCLRWPCDCCRVSVWA